MGPAQFGWHKCVCRRDYFCSVQLYGTGTFEGNFNFITFNFFLPSHIALLLLFKHKTLQHLLILLTLTARRSQGGAFQFWTFPILSSQSFQWLKKPAVFAKKIQKAFFKKYVAGYFLVEFLDNQTSWSYKKQ